MQTRRDFIKLSALLSGAGATGLLNSSIARAYAIEPEPGSNWLDAEHIVILMQENRSFDHALGMLRGVRGFNDPRALRLPNGNLVFLQTDQAGTTYGPWRLDIRDTRITWMGSLPHSRNSQVDAWNEGNHDHWLEAKRSGDGDYAHIPMTMGHYTREDLPFYYALADAFTVCDQYYCSVMSCTSPNRLYMWTGTNRDHESADSRVFITNDMIDPGFLSWKTFPERLQESNVAWKIYQNELTRAPFKSSEQENWLSNFGDNTIECFSAYNVQAYPGFAQIAPDWLQTANHMIGELQSALDQNPTGPKADFQRIELDRANSYKKQLEAAAADSGEAYYQKLSSEQKALFDSAFVTNAGDPDYRELTTIHFNDQGQERTMQAPKGDLFYQFRKDVEENKLPTVSWLVAPENFSDHPSAPWFGAWYVSEAMDILTKNPEVWKKTIFILNYDENDGYFDHAPSFVAADPKHPETGGASSGISTALDYSYANDEVIQGVEPKYARTGPIGLGYRVPVIIASPWTRGGWVNSQIFDHTSTIQLVEQFVEHKFGKQVHEANITDWRRAVCGDMTSAFRTYDAKESALPFVERNPFVIEIEEARYKEIPSNYKPLTSQQISAVNQNASKAGVLPEQEPGVKSSCALPYELYADLKPSDDSKGWSLLLTAGNQAHGVKSAGAPFNVYLRGLKNGKPMQAATYAVRAGDTLAPQIALDSFAGPDYGIDVHGPNGFYRAFSGSLAQANPLEVRMDYERLGGKLTGNVKLSLRNVSAKTVTAVVTDQSYGARALERHLDAGQKTALVLPLARSHGWYDFVVSTAGSKAEARYAGRVEAGRHSISDPFMGRMELA